MYDDLACRTGVLLFEMFHQTALAERVQALGDGGSVYQIPTTYLASYVTVESLQLYPPLHGTGNHHLIDRCYYLQRITDQGPAAVVNRRARTEERRLTSGKWVMEF